MIIQIVLIASIIAITSVVMLGRPSHVGRASRKAFFALFGVFAVIAITDPDLTTELANKVGVGRGADLLLYLLVVVFLFFALHVYKLFKKQERTIVRLARAMALQAAAHEAVMTSIARGDLDAAESSVANALPQAAQQRLEAEHLGAALQPGQ